MNGKAANMRFVNDGLRPRVAGWLVSIPIEGIVDKYAFRHRPGIVHGRESQVLLRRRRVVSTCRCKIPRRQSRNRGSEGIEEKPVEIETMSFVGFVRAIHAVAIELTGTNPFTQTCHTSPVRLRADPDRRFWTGLASSGWSNNSSRTRLASRPKTAKLTPPAVSSVPNGRGEPARTSALGRSPRYHRASRVGLFHHRCHRIRVTSSGIATPSAVAGQSAV